MLVEDFHVGFGEIAPLISYTVLILGCGAIIWIPTSALIGKRYTLLASTLVFLIGCIWSTQATSLQSLLGSRVLAAFGASAVQSLGPAVIGGKLKMLEKCGELVLTLGRNFFRKRLFQGHRLFCHQSLCWFPNWTLYRWSHLTKQGLAMVFYPDLYSRCCIFASCYFHSARDCHTHG